MNRGAVEPAKEDAAEVDDIDRAIEELKLAQGRGPGSSGNGDTSIRPTTSTSYQASCASTSST